LLDDFFTESGCSWCGDTDRKLYGKTLPLCGSCRYIKAFVRKSERNKDETPFGADDLATAKGMERMAKDQSIRFGYINRKQIDGVLLEHAFNQVAEIAIHRELPYNDANAYEEFFSLAQRRFLFYLLESIVRIYERKHRSTIAAYAPD
jgi:hypothetical protein